MTCMNMATLTIAVMVLLVASTYLLPRRIRVERSATVTVSAEQILLLAGSTLGYQRFNPYQTRDPELRIEPFGPAQGVGSGRVPPRWRAHPMAGCWPFSRPVRATSWQRKRRSPPHSSKRSSIGLGAETLPCTRR